MKMPANTQKTNPPVVKPLFMSIAASTLLVASYSHAGPTGGVVVGGGGSITQSGTTTRIDQSTDRLSLQWDAFNVAANERVEFVQPSSSAIALNRILDNDGTRILGQIDANGHIILMNPNGILFDQTATVNVGGLVASGLNINSDDFMNGDLLFAEVPGTAGTVVHAGIINAATGGNVALLGKSVSNEAGLISANLGHVALAAGSEAVVTFDEQGHIGVRIDKETLASEVEGYAAVRNEGDIEARGGKILLTASVSADLFSAAVNRGQLNDTTAAIMHDDGSFTLGAGNAVSNAGTIDVSSATDSDSDAGYAIVVGQTVAHRGNALANASGDNKAGQIYIEASGQMNLGEFTDLEAKSSGLTSGKVSLEADNFVTAAGAKVVTTGNTFITDIIGITEVSGVMLPQVNTHHLYLSGGGGVTQTGAITSSGNTHVEASVFTDGVRLTHVGNDFNTFSFDSEYSSATTVYDMNDITLGDVNVIDSYLDIETLSDSGTISQVADSHIQVTHGQLSLTGGNIELGSDNSSTNVAYGALFIDFTHYIDTNHSINEYGTDTLAHTFIRGSNGTRAVELIGADGVNLRAYLTEGNNTMPTLILGNVVGESMTLSGHFETSQDGSITLSDTLTWNSYRAILNNPENDIAGLQGDGGGSLGGLTYVDKNDVVIHNIDAPDENTVSITSVGTGGEISQAPNTHLRANSIALSADYIDLGANGTSEMTIVYELDIDFREHLNINGPYRWTGWYAPGFRITGDDGTNLLTFGPHATSNAFAADDLLANIYFDLGAGNDVAIFESDFLIGEAEDWDYGGLDMGAGRDFVFYKRADVNLPVTLGSGRDLVLVRGAGAYYDLTDYDSRKDRLYRFD